VRAKWIIAGFLAAASPLHAQFSLEGPLRCTGEQLLQVFEPQREVLQASSAHFRDGRVESGYGVIVSADGYILTKASEFETLSQPVAIIDRQRYQPVELLGVDRKWDVCLVKVDAQGLKPVQYAETSDLPLGTWVVGNGASSLFKRRLLMGVISARPHRIPPAGGLAIGVSLKEEKKGLVIGEVSDKGGAHKAGLQKGDIIRTADGKPVKTIKELAESLEAHHTGSQVQLGLKRDGKDLTLGVELMPKLELFAPPSRNDQMSGDFSTRRSDFPRVIQHSILGNSKSVGGPLLDLEGHCIGMNIARANRAESFAIPMEELREIASRLIAQSKGEKPEDAAGPKDAAD